MENQKKTNQLRVMHFVHWSRSGITSLVKSIAKYGSDLTDNFFMLLLFDKDFGRYYESIGKKLQLNARKNLIHAIFLLLREYKTFRPHIVHAHSFSPLLISALLLNHSRTIFHVHSIYPFLLNNDFKSKVKRTILRLLIKNRRVTVIAVSKEIAQLFKSEYKINAVYLQNGIPDIGVVRSKFSQEHPQGRFYTVSRLSKEKNIEFGIQIVKLLRNRNNDVSFDIYGDGGEKGYLQKAISDNGLEGSVRLKGFVRQPENLPSMYDFYLSPSLFEGFSLSLLDALRGMTPVVMTRVGELANILEDGESAIFIDHDLLESVKIIERILSWNVCDMERLQIAGRKIFEDKFRIEKLINGLILIYNQILNY